MSNSPLVIYTKLSPFNSGARNHEIDRITVHYADGNCSLEGFGSIFTEPNRNASCQYGIDEHGRVGQYCLEKNRSWCSGSSYNDNRAITIECANYSDGSISNACWDTLIRLCADICRRNGISRLVYTGDDSGNLTKHKWYDSTDCPGPWLDSRFGAIARQVNKLLETQPSTGIGGTYRCRVLELNVRTKPTTKSDIVATYVLGQLVVLDDWSTSADGYLWGRYVAYSGNVRYVAIGRDTGRVEPDDFLVRV